MKKLLFVLLLSLLTACGAEEPKEEAEEEPAAATTEESKKEEKGKEQEEVTKEEVIKRSLNNDVQSFEMTVSGRVNMLSNGEHFEQYFDLENKYIKNPFINYSRITSNNGTFHMYLNDEAAYMLVPSGQWIKGSISAYEAMPGISTGEVFRDELLLAEKFLNLFSLEEIEDGYKLTIKKDVGSEAENNTLAREILKKGFEGAVIENIIIKEMDYIYILDKNFFLKKGDTYVEVDATIDGIKNSVKIDSESDYTNYNDVEPFSIPQEAKEQATPAGSVS